MSLSRAPMVDEFCGLLERMLVASAAAAVEVDRLPDGPFHFVAAPMWLWRVSAVPVAGKDRSADGSRLLMPVRVAHDGPVLMPVTEAVTVTVAGAGLGLQVRDRVVLDPAVRDHGTWLYCPGAHAAGAVLDGIVEDGVAARWEAAMWAEKLVRQAVRRAHAQLSASVHDGPFVPLLDECALEEVETEVTFGAASGLVSPLNRLLERALQPGTFAKVDPLRYLAYNLTRDAFLVVARRVDDPKAGPAIREMHRQLGDVPVEEFVDRYRRRYLRGLSLETVQRALTTGSTLDVLARRLPETISA